MSTTLPLFWHLSSNSKQERFESSVKLLSALNQFQAQFTQKSRNNSEEDDSDQEDVTESDGLDALNAHDVVYSIRRLIRGLSSPRESSRIGYAVALTELLSQLETVTCAQIISLIMESSKASGTSTGQEERDSLFARLFGLTAVIQSGLVVNPNALPTSASSASTVSDLSSYEETISQLLVLGDKKSWLRESSWWSLGLAIDALEASNVSWKEDALSFTYRKLSDLDVYWSPEKVALTLKLQTLHPDYDWKSVLSPVFKNPRLLSSANLVTLARIMKESGHEAENEESLKSVAGGWKPQIHFAWKMIIDHLLAHPNGKAEASFQEFFRVVVDESLFASNSSAQRKYWGFQVFQEALPRLDATSLSMLFTKNFMRTWINHLSHQDRYLHKAAKQVVSDIQSVVKSNPQLGFALVLQLTGANGSGQFDRLTRTKTVEGILASMDADGIRSYINHLLEQVDIEDEQDTQARDARRLWAVEQLSFLIRNGSIPKNDEWVQRVLNWFAINGLYSLKKATAKLPILPVRTMSDALRETCRTRLLSSLAELTSQTGSIKDGAVSKVPGIASDGKFWVCRTLDTIQSLESSKYVTLVLPLDNEHVQDWEAAKATLNRIQQMSSSSSSLKGAELLLAANILQQYCTEDIDYDGFNACVQSISDMFPEKKKKAKHSKANSSAKNEDSESIVEPIDVLVDVIIGFMERSTNYLRTIGNQAFGLLSESVKSSTVDLILTQLERRDPTRIAEDVEEDDSEGEVIDAEASEPSSSSSDDDEDDDDDEEEDVETRNKIESALRASGLAGDEDSDEDLMDDDQMMAIDEQLAEIFRSRANEKLNGKDVNAQREATHFKNRVLDLVETFIKRQPSSNLIPHFILPLIDVISGCGADERQFSDKAKGILQSRIGKLKEGISDPNIPEISMTFSDLHSRSRKSKYAGVLGVLSHCSLYLSRILINGNAQDLVVKEYETSLTDFLTRKASPLNPIIFQDFIKRHSLVAWGLGGVILESTSQSVNLYRRCQAFNLLHVLVSQLPNMDDRRKKVENFMPKLRDRLHEVLSAASADEVAFSTAQMRDLLKLGLLAERQTLVNAPELAENIWKPDTWIALQSKLESSPRYKASKQLLTMCGQMAKLISPKPPPTKRKAPESNGGENHKPKRKKK